tara:strand:+ start:119 stop:1342 length:1224 start_codon:yes stop_codon:yes gene_type:complete
MASLFDYYNQGSGKKAPTGYSFRTSNSGNDVYTPVSNLNRANNYRRNPERGGGRSNLDNQRGFSNQGIGSFSNRQPGLFGSRTAVPSPAMTGRSAAASNVLPISDEDKMRGQPDEGLGKNIVNDAKTMASNLTPNVNMKMPGLMGLFGAFGESIGNNQEDHRYLNSVFGRASPDKTMAFFDKAGYDMNQNMGTDNVGTMQIGDSSRGSSLGQADKYFRRAGITQQNIDRFMDPNDKFYGSEAYLASQAGGSGAEDFATGMSFIKNAKASANLARDVAGQQARQQFTQNAYENPSSRASPLDDYSAYDDITETITDDSYPNRPPLFEEDFSEDVYSDRQPQLFGSRRDQLEPFEAQRQKATFFDRGMGPRGMGPDQTFFGGMEYPFGVDFDDTEDDLGPRGRFSLYDN